MAHFVFESSNWRERYFFKMVVFLKITIINEKKYYKESFKENINSFMLFFSNKAS
jgi:hypothetical protein